MGNVLNRSTDLRRILQQMTSQPPGHYLAKVLEVSLENRTALVEDLQDGTITEVLLQSSLAVSGVLLVPQVDSWVLVAQLNEAGAGSVVLTSELDGIEVTIGNSSLSIKDGLMVFNGGELGGLVKADALTDKLNKLEQEVSTLKARLTTFETVFNGHTHLLILPTPNTPTASPIPVTVIGDAAPLLSTLSRELQNEKLTH